LRSVECHEFDGAAPLREVVKELHRVPELLLGLDTHPVREAVEMVGREIGGHGQVEIEGKELGMNLFVESLFDFCVHCQNSFCDDEWRRADRPKPSDSITLPARPPFLIGNQFVGCSGSVPVTECQSIHGRMLLNECA
jgi:hypothetical protein